MLQNIRLSPGERRAAKERSDLILKEFRGCLPDLDRDTFDSVPDRFKKIWMLAYQQRTPKGAALVKAKCLDCCG